jgi:hypothetical protein
MEHPSVKILLSCALGAAIGSLVALELSTTFWWVGLIVGGLTGYLSYEWPAVRAAIPVAYRSARGWSAMKGDAPLNKMAAESIAYGSYLPLVVLLIPWVLIPLMQIPDSEKSPMAAVVFLLVSSYALIGGGYTNFRLWDEFSCRRSTTIAYVWESSSPYVLLWQFPRVIITFLITFTWRLFLLIHSERRLICGVDAAIGAGVGYMSGSVIVDALAGAVLGVVNYELITRRVLIPRGLVTLKT